MRASQRTLMLRMGFQDKDRNDPRHDLACQYLCVPGIALPIFRSATHANALLKDVETEHVAVLPYVDLLEPPRIVGFVDAVLRGHDGNVGVEVKALPQSIGQAVRQLKTYAMFTTRGGGGIIQMDRRPTTQIIETWMLVTAYPLDDEEVGQLTRNGFSHHYLGKEFDEYCVRRLHGVKT